MKNLSICLLILCFSAAIPLKLPAQELLKDSLQSLLKQNNISAHQRVMTMSRLAKVFSYGQISKADSLNKKAIQLAKMTRDTNGLTFSWVRQVAIEGINGQEKLARQAVDSALLYAPNATPLNHGIALFEKGWLQNYLGAQDDALESWQEAQIYLNEPRGAKYQSNIYNLKFGIFSERGELKKATYYARLALTKALQSGDPALITSAWQINGTNYFSLYQQKKQPHFLDSATYAFKQSIKVFRQKKEWIPDPGLVVLSALNLANIQINHFQPACKDSILAYLDLALETSKVSKSRIMEANTYEVICRLYSRTGQLDKAERAVIKAKNIVDSLAPPDVYTSMNVYLLYSMLKEKQGDDGAALKYYKKYVGYYRDEFNAQRNRTIQQLEAKYQNKKKEEALRLLQQQNIFQEKKTRLYITIALIAIIGLLALFLAYRFRLKYALQREKLKDEEAARFQAEQKLMQNQKEQLQKELLVGALQVEHKNEILQNLKEKLMEKPDTEPAKRQLEKIINEEMRVDEDFENIRSEFKDLHPEFFTRLQEKAGKKLTELDLKYCAYFFMKLPTKQIANLLGVEPKSVRMTRYRLKQKLGLGKEDDLDEFISSISKR